MSQSPKLTNYILALILLINFKPLTLILLMNLLRKEFIVKTQHI